MADLIFGKYEIQHRIAIGGMGEVFVAVQKGVPGFQRPVILKSLLPDLALQEGFIEQFLDEARVAATLNHPNVVSIYEVGLWNGTYFIAMEYIRGRNLAQLLRRSIEQQTTLPVQVAGRIVHDAAVGLDHAHHATDVNGNSLNIVHRDISPQNIMVREDGVTKVVDFGIAHASNRAASRTATGALKGKLAYMAPEQIAGQTSALVDQFALGIVFWELLACRRLFKAESDILIARKVMEEPIPLPSSVAANVTPAIDAVVMKMLERNPSRRFASCADAASAIDHALAGLTPTGSSPITAFMRRLGTDDLSSTLKSLAPASNFVISLKPNQGDGSGSGKSPSFRSRPAPIVQPPPLQEPSAAAPPGSARKTKVLVGVIAASVLALIIATAFMLAGRTQDGVLIQDAQAGIGPKPLMPASPAPPVIEKPVTVVTAAAPVAPKVAVIRIDSLPGGAAIHLDGRPLGAAPQTTKVTAGAVHYLQVEKPGFRRAEQEVSAEPGEEKDVLVKLVERLPGPAVPNAPVSNAAGGGPGFLTLDTTPWTKVSIDGDPYGLVPLSRKRLPSGKHTLELVNEGENIRVTRVIEISPNKVTKLQLTLP